LLVREGGTGSPDDRTANALATGLDKSLKRRVRAGIAQARKEGKRHGRPATARQHAEEAKTLLKQGISKRQIAKRLGIGRTSVRRIVS